MQYLLVKRFYLKDYKLNAILACLLVNYVAETITLSRKPRRTYSIHVLLLLILCIYATGFQC